MNPRRVMLMVEVVTSAAIKDLEKIIVSNLSLVSNVKVIQVQANVIKKEKK